MSQMFTVSTGLRRGYAQAEVNEFFEYARSVYESQIDDSLTQREIHTHVFGMERGGYVIGEVDAAMDRLENAFVAKHRQDVLNTRGPSGWSEELNNQAQTLYPRLSRKAGTRFAPPTKGKGYSADQVDAMCRRLVSFFNGKEQVTAAEIRAIRFDAARGKNAYEETSVDAFVARAVEVLLGVA